MENDNINTQEEQEEEHSESNQSQVIELQEENALLKDTLLRKAAEAENVRKRLEKEKADAVAYANSSFARDLLPVLDNFERVISGADSLQEQIKDNDGLLALLDGIKLSQKELISVLRKHGISLVEVADGDDFNHEYHQAMCEVESDTYEAGKVTQVLQTGYTYHNRLLRPAMVSVSKKHV